MNYLTDKIYLNANKESNIGNHHIESEERLQERLRLSKECAFKQKKQDVLHFEFLDYTITKIKLPHFSLRFVKKTQSLLCYTKHRKAKKCLLLATRNKVNDTYYYMTISNNWYALDKFGNFEAMNDLKCN